MKKILSLILAFFIFNTLSAADSDWRIHPIFDEEVTHVVETPEYVYFTSRQMMQNPISEVYFSLFRYDKKGEELTALSTFNLLNGNTIRDIFYNPMKGYVAVLYKDYNIDLLHNNGSVTNIPYYKQTTMTHSKGVNSFAADPDHDRLFLATDFGYIAINDKKNEIAESRIYGEPLKAFCRIGDKYLVIIGNELLSIDADSSRLSISQYNVIKDFDSPRYLYPLNDNSCLLIGGLNENQYGNVLTFTQDGIEEKKINIGNIINIENTAQGVVVSTSNEIFQFKYDGTHSAILRDSNFKDCAVTTNNMTDFWYGMKRKGLCNVKNNNDQWTVIRNWMLPSAPATFASGYFVNHPTKGLLMTNYGCEPVFMSLFNSPLIQISGYHNGQWTNYAPSYTLGERDNMLNGVNGILLDPDNSNYIYMSSLRNGIARLNLSDPNDIIHLSFSKDADAGNSGFAVLDFYPSSQVGWCNITAPFFDAKGNMWMALANYDGVSDPHPNYYCWLAEDRRATNSFQNLRQPKHVEMKSLYCPVNNSDLSLPLLATGNGLIVRASFRSGSGAFIAIYDTNGTPVDTNDDKEYIFNNITDSDGNHIEMGRVHFLWEDPSTGYVWVGHESGVCYFIPKQVLAGNYQFHKIKVPRNDGTNLADYLLEGVTVNNLLADPVGRKWFATTGGGVVCTSSDGREILEEFTVANSLLPDDVVYGIGYNSENNSLMFSTAQGYAEYFLPASRQESSKVDVRAYPNPVRPEFSGYVTITDIPQGSLVKITDVKGNLVKDLRIMSGFEMLWDISDSNFNRVKTGVYHIMVSPSDESSSYSAVGKILVVS